jgi:hypothetical protein
VKRHNSFLCARLAEAFFDIFLTEPESAGGASSGFVLLQSSRAFAAACEEWSVDDARFESGNNTKRYFIGLIDNGNHLPVMDDFDCTDRHVRGGDVINERGLPSGIQLPKTEASVRVTRYGNSPVETHAADMASRSRTPSNMVPLTVTTSISRSPTAKMRWTESQMRRNLTGKFQASSRMKLQLEM